MCLAIPGEVIDVVEGASDLERRGRVRLGGGVRAVTLACVPDAGVGDYVLVHVGWAIATVDPDQAQRVFETLEELGELDELEGPA